MWKEWDLLEVFLKENDFLSIDEKKIKQLSRLSSIWQLIDLTKWKVLDWVDNAKINTPDILKVSEMILWQIENVLWEEPENLRDKSIEKTAIKIWDELIKRKNVLDFAIWNFIKRIAYQVSNVHLRYERYNKHKENSSLKTKNKIDSLTKLLNREATNEYLQWVINKKNKAENKENYWVILIDIDHFKNINDSYWHVTWDIVIEEISKIFAKKFRKTDKVWRWWWEEFIIIMEWWDSKEHWEKLENIRDFIEQNLVKIVNDKIRSEWNLEEINLKNITVSIGITELIEGDDIWSVTNRADRALYNSKETWRNMVSSINWYTKKSN